MNDGRNMASEHLDDCLEYLYEELPPAGMAEARRHLADCPECRAEIRAVRETVKQYRTTPKPAPPPGLAERTAAAVRAEMQAPSALLPPMPAGGVSEAEFAQLKKELLAEVPRSWRTWFYHPAWMVAASAVFICSLLIHFSPRYSGRLNRPPVAAPFENRDQSLERLPAAAPRRQAAPARAVEPDSRPELREAEAWTAEMEASPEARVWIPSPAVASASPSTASPPPAAAAQGTQKMADALPVPAPISVAAAPFLSVSATPAAPVSAESARQRSSGHSAELVLVDMFGRADPPQLIARPTPIDTVKLARDLATLAGMQISHGEMAEAWLSIGMLRKYDAEKADELTRILEAKEAELAAARAAAAKYGDGETEKAESAPAVDSAADSSFPVADRAVTQTVIAEPEANVKPEMKAPPSAGHVEIIVPAPAAAAIADMAPEQPPVSADAQSLPAVPLRSSEPIPAKRPIFSTDPYVRND